MKKLIRFTASWCGPCKALAKNLETADLGIPIEVVDIDENIELAAKYQIRGVPTLVLESEEGQKRLVGLQPVSAIKEWINS